MHELHGLHNTYPLYETCLTVGESFFILGVLVVILAAFAVALLSPVPPDDGGQK